MYLAQGYNTATPGADPGFLDRGFKFGKGGGVRFPSFASFFLKFPMKMKQFSLSEPPEPPLDPPLDPTEDRTSDLNLTIHFRHFSGF